MMQRNAQRFKPLVGAMFKPNKNPHENTIYNSKLWLEEGVSRIASMRDEVEREKIIRNLPEDLADKVRTEIAENYPRINYSAGK